MNIVHLVVLAARLGIEKVRVFRIGHPFGASILQRNKQVARTSELALFKRSRLFIRSLPPTQILRPLKTSQVIGASSNFIEGECGDRLSSLAPPVAPIVKDLTVLVINSSQERAKEFTMQLSISLPGSGMIYAPTVELAKWVLSRRRIDLIVADEILPDGNISRLEASLEKLSYRPHLVVVGTSTTPRDLLKNYEFKKASPLSPRRKLQRPADDGRSQHANTTLDTTLCHLGNDIRNDLNNPLQAIVAMLFVAQSNKHSTDLTDQALAAIENAAGRMTEVVNGLEGKIRAALK